MTTYLIVRAKVDPTVRKTFDNWYEREHLPDAQKAFDAISARRGWSKMEPNTHIALYEFSNLDVAEKAMSSNYINDLIKDKISSFNEPKNKHERIKGIPITLTNNLDFLDFLFIIKTT